MESSGARIVPPRSTATSSVSSTRAAAPPSGAPRPDRNAGQPEVAFEAATERASIRRAAPARACARRPLLAPSRSPPPRGRRSRSTTRARRRASSRAERARESAPTCRRAPSPRRGMDQCAHARARARRSPPAARPSRASPRPRTARQRAAWHHCRCSGPPSRRPPSIRHAFELTKSRAAPWSARGGSASPVDVQVAFRIATSPQIHASSSGSSPAENAISARNAGASTGPKTSTPSNE